MPCRPSASIRKNPTLCRSKAIVTNQTEVLVPDIGGFKDVSVIDVLVKDGQQIEKETPMITLETEKAAMDVPSPAAGRIAQIKLKKGDKVSEGSLILLLESGEEAQEASAPAKPIEGGKQGGDAQPRDAAKPGDTAKPAGAPKAADDSTQPGKSNATPAAQSPTAQPPAAQPPSRPQQGAAVSGAQPAAPSHPGTSVDEAAFSKAYASPSVRKFARELGADLGKISGTGPKSRITHEDVKAYVKKLLAAGAGAGAGALPKVPEVDFASFGPVDIKPLSRIQRISGARLQASWINLPHVTQHDEADITDMDAARTALKTKASQEGVGLTPRAFIIK